MASPPESKVCPECSHFNPLEVNYCGRCGKYVGDGVQETLTKPFPLSPQAGGDVLFFAPGQKFGGRYLIIEEIGRGGMGRVFKAHDRELNVDVALKMIRPERSGDPGFIQRFKQETLLGRAVSQENVVRVFDLGEVDGVKFISMEYIKGQTLADLIRASGRLSAETAVGLLQQVCRALAAAHRQSVVHQDLKPQNILIDRKGLVRVADFGLARTVDVRGGLPEDWGGTPAYLSPEQAQGGPVDHRADLYALGVILYEMVTGRKPFEAETTAELLKKHVAENPLPPSRWNPRLLPGFEALILKCLEKDKEKRFQSAEEVLEAAQALGLQRTSPWSRSRRAGLLAGLASLLLAAAAVFRFVVFPPKPRAPDTAKGRRITVAVMYFENDTGEPNLDYLRKTLATLIIQDLLSSRFIRVITGEQLFQILDDLHLDKNRTYSENDLRLVAERAQAGYILHGSLARLGEVYGIHTLLHRVADWDLKGVHSLDERGLEGINAMVDALTVQIKSDLNITQKDISADIDQDVGKITTRSPAALKLFWEGTELYHQRKFQESNARLAEALALDPEFALAYFRTAVNDSYLGNTIEAKKNLEKALSLADRVSPWEKYLIRGSYAANYAPSPQDAIRIYQDFLVQYPDDENGLIALGSLYRQLEDWDAAEALFEKACRLNIYNDVTYVNLSHIAMAKGQYDRARSLLEVNRSIFNETNYHYFLATVSLSQGRYEQALAETHSILAQDPGDASALLLRGHAAALQGDALSAEKAYRLVLQRPDASRRIMARRGLACLALAQGRVKDCRREISLGLVQARESGQQEGEYSLQKLAACLELRRKQFPAALASAQDALRIARDIPNAEYEKQALHLLGLAEAMIGRLQDASETAEKLKKLVEQTGNRRHLRYYRHLRGIIALQRDAPDQALAELEGAVSLLSGQNRPTDEHAFFLEALALAQEKKGDMERASRTYQDIAALTTGRLGWGDIAAESFLRLAGLRQKQGFEDQAREAYRSFFRLYRNADPDLPEIREARREQKKLNQASTF